MFKGKSISMPTVDETESSLDELCGMKVQMRLTFLNNIGLHFPHSNLIQCSKNSTAPLISTRLLRNLSPSVIHIINL